MGNKIAVVTAIGGGKDNVLPVMPKFTSAEYHLFIDNPKPYPGWDVVHELPQFSQRTRPDRRNAKLPKVMPFFALPGFDYVIWQDGGHMVQTEPSALIEKFLVGPGKEVATFQHGRQLAGQNHNCIYKESVNVKNVGFLEDPVLVDEQMAAYKADGFPVNYGLGCTAGIMWKNTPEMQRLGLTWFEQLCRYTSRDQLSFFYCLWKLGLKDRFGYIDGNWERNPYVRRMQGHANVRK